MLRTVEPTWRLEWLKNKHRLPEQLDDGSSHTFGPFYAKGPDFHVRYDAATEGWELLQLVDTSLDDYSQRRGTVVRLAEEYRGRMERREFVQLLILAAIDTGLDRRSDILDTVELAANLPAVQQSVDTRADYTSIPSDFDEAFIRATLDRGRGRDPRRHLWRVEGGRYRRH